MTEQTRRQFVRLAGVTAIGVAGTLATALAQTAGDGEWEAVESPTDEPLNGVVERSSQPSTGADGNRDRTETRTRTGRRIAPVRRQTKA